MYEWAGGEPDPIHVSSLANVVDMVGRIADCCDDGALRRLIEGTPAYAELVDEEIRYQGEGGRKRWKELSESWLTRRSRGSRGFVSGEARASACCSWGYRSWCSEPEQPIRLICKRSQTI